MLSLDIPGYKTLEIQHVLLDYNGTLAEDGELLPGVDTMLMRLAKDFELHVLTADTFGRCKLAMDGLPVNIHILKTPPEDEAKILYARNLGAKNCACLGNGRNDRLMMAACALGICVLGTEGASVHAMNAADIVVPNIIKGLELLLHPKRVEATLRN